MAIVLHHSKARGTAKLVLLGIANHEGDGGAWPSVATLSVYAGCSDRQVQRAIAWLRGHGEIAVLSQGGGERDTPDAERPNLYRVLIACPPWCDRTPNHRDTRRWSGRQRSLPLPVDNRVTPTSPGDTHVTGGVTPTSPGGVTPTSPEPSIEPTTHQVVSQLQDTRACSECAQPQARCLALQGSWPLADRHDYQPVSRASG